MGARESEVKHHETLLAALEKAGELTTEWMQGCASPDDAGLGRRYLGELLEEISRVQRAFTQSRQASQLAQHLETSTPSLLVESLGAIQDRWNQRAFSRVVQDMHEASETESTVANR